MKKSVIKGRPILYSLTTSVLFKGRVGIFAIYGRISDFFFVIDNWGPKEKEFHEKKFFSSRLLGAVV